MHLLNSKLVTKYRKTVVKLWTLLIIFFLILVLIWEKNDTPPNVDHTLYFKYINYQSMFFWPTDENQLENISSDLKSNSIAGHDELPSNILSTSKAFLKPLTHIINCSLNTGIVPDNMKIAKLPLSLKRMINMI